MAELAKEVFGPGKPGFVIVVLVMLAAGSWIGEMVTTAMRKGNWTSLVSTGSYVAGILAVVAIVWSLLSKFFSFVTAGTM